MFSAFKCVFTPSARVTRWVASGALVLVAASVTLQAAGGLRIIPLVRDEQVLVTFELTDGFTDDVRNAILSGLRTTFTFNVDLRLEVPAWVDRTVESAVVTNSVQYDNLTRRHMITRMIDGHSEQTQVTEDEAVVRQWMTSFRQLPLFRTARLQPNREYYVRVVATARPQNGVFLWPWGNGTSAMQKFTFIR
jgi:hypothetical protein